LASVLCWAAGGNERIEPIAPIPHFLTGSESHYSVNPLEGSELAELAGASGAAQPGFVTEGDSTSIVVRAPLTLKDSRQDAVTLHFRLIEADGGTTTGDRSIAEVVQALRQVLRFEGYRLIGEAVLSNVMPNPDLATPLSRGDPGQLSQIIRTSGSEYVLQVDLHSITPDPGGRGSVELTILLLRRPTNGNSESATRVLRIGGRIPLGGTFVMGSEPTGLAIPVILTVRAEIDTQ
jgi:hypothetical protein